MDKKRSSKSKLPKGESRAAAWKEKFETLDEKYSRMKDILKQVLHDMKEESEALQLIKIENRELKKELNDKENILDRLQSVSEAVVDEYSILKAKYEMESEAATAATKRATKYLQQNIILKRKSTVPSHKPADFLQVDLPDSLADENELDVDNQNSEIELLSKTISDLRGEVANLKIQLEKEVRKQDSLKGDIQITQKLFEDEMVAHNETKTKLKLEEISMEQMKRVSELYVVKELGELQSRCQKESDKVKRISSEIAAVQKENSVLSEQQSVLINNSSPNDQLSSALNKIEELRAELDDETKRHQMEVEELLNKMVEFEDQSSLRAAENKLQCLEECLEHSEQRAYASERQVETLKHRVQELECQIQRLNAGLPAPPPPPPPPPPPSFNPIKSLITLISSAKKASTVSSLKKEVGNNQQQKAMSEMISAIKKGNVHLRPAPKGSGANYDKTDEESAVGEMKDMLCSLKKKVATTGSVLSQSESSKSSSNELLAKLEKWRKISSLCEQPCNSKKNHASNGEVNIERKEPLQIVKVDILGEEVKYENACSSTGEDFVDTISSPGSCVEEVSSSHTSENDDMDYVNLRKHSLTSENDDIDYVNLRKHSLTSENDDMEYVNLRRTSQTTNFSVDLTYENVNISRCTFLVNSPSGKSPILSDNLTQTTNDHSLSEDLKKLSLLSLNSDKQVSNEGSGCENIEANDEKHGIQTVDVSDIQSTAEDCSQIDNTFSDTCSSTQSLHEMESMESPLACALSTCSDPINEHMSVSKGLPEVQLSKEMDVGDDLNSLENADSKDTTSPIETEIPG